MRRLVCLNKTIPLVCSQFVPKLLLDHGADPNIRASLRKKPHPGYSPKYDVETTYEYRNITPLGWGRQFHAKVFVSEPAMRLIEEHGGVE
jgi:hypothetical protein